jgi:transcriptional regulator with XRE-family HTH domain
MPTKERTMKTREDRIERKQKVLVKRFVESIRDILHAKNITQSELAGKMGVSAPYISQLLNGKYENPSIHLLVQLADHLDYSVDGIVLSPKVR